VALLWNNDLQLRGSYESSPPCKLETTCSLWWDFIDMWNITWLIRTWHDSSSIPDPHIERDVTHTCMTWFIRMWHDSFKCDMWQDLFICDMTRASIPDLHIKLEMTRSIVTRCIGMWNVTWAIRTWHDSFIISPFTYSTWRDLFVHHMTHSCVKWLFH